MPDQLVPVVEPDGVGALEPSHAGYQVRVWRFQNQVVMVAHEVLRMHLPRGLLASFGERLEKILTIDIIQVNVLPSISPAHNVIHGAGVLNSQLSWHLERRVRPASLVNQENSTRPPMSMLWADPFLAFGSGAQCHHVG